ncbi:carbohydrate ABC transporter permease, partial [Streptomyces sp. DT225]
MTYTPVHPRGSLSPRVLGRLAGLAKAVLFTVVCAVVIVPFIGMISTSLASREQVTNAGGYV